MKKQNPYTRNQRLSYQIAGVLLIVATLGFTFMYFYQKNAKNQQELAKQEESQETQDVAGTVEPKSNEVDMAALEKERMNAAELSKAQEETAQDVIDKVAETSGLSLHFPDQIGWPVEGKVLLNFSMDQTVYFPTLKQYQYNPALIISSKVNDKVSSVCEGKVVSILNDAKTGTTMTVDLGDGYQAVYGQLKEIPVATGEYVAKGQCIGYVGEPSKYYLEEGPNLYFQILKDGSPMNPQEYLEQ